MRILVVIGTRPEAIKMAPVIEELGKRGDGIEVEVCVTAQHREMLDQVLELFGILPRVDLDLMERAQSPNRVAARVLSGIDRVLDEIRPDWILIQGDTTTTMAAALAAFHRKVRIGHVEAGLRTHDRSAPFPEEGNRIIADQLSDLHFAPTEQARRNLIREGIGEHSIHVTGNTVVDALRWALKRPLPEASLRMLKKIEDSRERPLTILVTAHRRESHGPPLKSICAAVAEIAQKHPDCQVLFPVHPNPQVRSQVEKSLSNLPGVLLLPPVDYLTLVHLIKESAWVLTDSGGIQEEAATLGVPVLVMRRRSDRPESVDSGQAVLVGTSRQKIVQEAQRLLQRRNDPNRRSSSAQPYGDGRAAERIADVLLNARAKPRGH